MVDGVDDGQQIHGYVDPAGNPRDLRRLQLAAGVDAIGDDEDRAVPIRAIADPPRGLRNGVEERRLTPRRPFQLHATQASEVRGEFDDFLQLGIEREERRLVAAGPQRRHRNADGRSAPGRYCRRRTCCR